MTALEWGTVTPKYEFGVDRGIIQLGEEIKAWPGLISVDETEVDATELKAYFDGVAYVNQHFGGVYQAVVTAHDFVKGFESILGYQAVVPGFFLTGQKKETFNFSYRTRVGEDGYKIHIIYNAIATPISMDSSSINDDADPNRRRWRIDTVPVESGVKRSSHFVFDSTLLDPFFWDNFTTYFYGDDMLPPTFPSPETLLMGG